ncbi:Repressible alkaline phosphatase [Komagataella phaffii CBS 7435]|uniref:Alkaline phosphatase n=2 Tax=Komagataella phaffii TaxID=460519 RepID=C4R2X1_KOMPG|nr:Repressible alkaline phosphatase, a glycoprotein localized to the vacuole [Komagataella phaffii GS115]AOA62631.1 GQ67_01262T0 [Komagataella phaffii]CAH2447598.1 Repressible alkaline phosphatase [Komagataella phaffii CBS 7435]AOA67745.1 GQ68_00128T0 [Komagataella phaffii GS115]CAY69845.1 Repressible alkaline phosphatase, a glycoprotein localized to the vacuole [Komagataella phaffii GS115]CCA37787.1 Repressible alkaline phosphatase [Komagataella phaffii CBS 7435]
MDSEPLLPNPNDSRKPANWRRIIKYISLTLAWIGIFSYVYIYHGTASKLTPTKKNVIFMVTDGMGPASVTVARDFKQFKYDLSWDEQLFIDTYLVGSSRTRSFDSWVTDSAAGATAFSCRSKTGNNMVAVDYDSKPLGTVLEAAKLQGFKTGISVTTYVSDATPAAFASHSVTRWNADLITKHLLGDYPLGRSLDLMVGGGRCFFYGRKDGGCRYDGENLLKTAKHSGWNLLENKTAFDALGENNAPVDLPLMVLLAEGNFPFEIDRNASEHPSIGEQTHKVLDILDKATKKDDQGFFVLIEGSRIDHAGHYNDAAAQVQEVLAFDEAFQAAVEFADDSSVETLIISVSDHETGGLSAAKQVTPNYPDYAWFPEVLLNVTHSSEYLAAKLSNYKETDLLSFIEEDILQDGMGIYDATPEEIQAIKKARHKSLDVLSKIISKRAQVGFSTHGHSAVDVNIYAHGNTPALQKRIDKYLRGNHDNTDIGKFMESWLRVDLDEVTAQLEGLSVGEGSHYSSFGVEQHPL